MFANKFYPYDDCPIKHQIILERQLPISFFNFPKELWIDGRHGCTR